MRAFAYPLARRPQDPLPNGGAPAHAANSRNPDARDGIPKSLAVIPGKPRIQEETLLGYEPVSTADRMGRRRLVLRKPDRFFL